MSKANKGESSKSSKSLRHHSTASSKEASSSDGAAVKDNHPPLYSPILDVISMFEKIGIEQPSERLILYELKKRFEEHIRIAVDYGVEQGTLIRQNGKVWTRKSRTMKDEKRYRLFM